MPQPPASIIQDTLADTFKRNTPEAWVRFGERVVEALAKAGFTIGEERDAYDELMETCCGKQVLSSEHRWDQLHVRPVQSND